MFVDFSTGFWTYPLLLFTLLFHFASDATKLLTIPQNMHGEKLFLQYLTAESNRNSLQVIAKIVQQCQYITFCSPQTVSCESKNSNGLSGAEFLWDDFFSFFRCWISCAHKQQVEANKNICAIFTAWKVTLECCMSYEHWPNEDFTGFRKNNLVYFWPRLPKVKVFVFLEHIWPRLLTVTFFFLFGQGCQQHIFCFFLGHFWSSIPTVKVFVFWAFLPKDNKGESFCFFLDIFSQGYQWWRF